MQPRGLPLWLRRARELVEGLHNTQAATNPQQFRPPPWLRPPWERSEEPAPSWPPRPGGRRQQLPHSTSRTHAPSPRLAQQPPLSTAQQQQPTIKPPSTQTSPLPLPHSTRTAEDQAGKNMRCVLRNVAQPVVLAVTASGSTFHGATLTSFASLTLEPHPLIAFSLRLPSRLADCLRPPPPEPHAGDCAPGNMCAPPAQPTRLAISLLSSANEGVADALARPGHQGDFGVGWDRMGGIPVVSGGVGGLLCQVVHTVPLRDVGGDTTSDNAGSELFVCRVLEAKMGEGVDSLVHYQREYGSVRGE